MKHSDFVSPARTWATIGAPADAHWRDPNFTYIKHEQHTLENFSERMKARREAVAFEKKLAEASAEQVAQLIAGLK